MTAEIIDLDAFRNQKCYLEKNKQRTEDPPRVQEQLEKLGEHAEAFYGVLVRLGNGRTPSPSEIEEHLGPEIYRSVEGHRKDLRVAGQELKQGKPIKEERFRRLVEWRFPKAFQEHFPCLSF